MEESKTEQSKKTKKRGFEPPSVTMMPDFQGITVIDGQHGGEALIDTHYPWQRVAFYQSTLRLFDQEYERVRVEGRLLMSHAKGGNSIASRLKFRAAKHWANHSTDPLTFEPKHRSIPVWWMFSIIFFASLMTLPGMMVYKTIMQLSGEPIHAIHYAVFASALGLVIVFLLLAYGYWKIRPRKAAFSSVDLFPTGIVATTFDNQVVQFEWTDLKSSKRISLNPTRFRYETKTGETYWVTYPQWAGIYASQAYFKTQPKPKKSKLGPGKPLIIDGIRMIIIGIGLGFLMAWVIQNLHLWVPHMAPFPPHLPRVIFWFSFAMPGTLGVMFIWLAFLSTPKYQRRRHARNRRLLKRYPWLAMEQSKPKVTPKNTTP